MDKWKKVSMALFAVMIIAIILMSLYIANNELGKAINTAYFQGIQDGGVNVFDIAYKNGFVNMNINNETVRVYSPQGCIDAVKAATQGG